MPNFQARPRGPPARSRHPRHNQAIGINVVVDPAGPGGGHVGGEHAGHAVLHLSGAPLETRRAGGRPRRWPRPSSARRSRRSRSRDLPVQDSNASSRDESDVNCLNPGRRHRWHLPDDPTPGQLTGPIPRAAVAPGRPSPPRRDRAGRGHPAAGACRTAAGAVRSRPAGSGRGPRARGPATGRRPASAAGERRGRRRGRPGCHPRLETHDEHDPRRRRLPAGRCSPAAARRDDPAAQAPVISDVAPRPSARAPKVWGRRA